MHIRICSCLAAAASRCKRLACQHTHTHTHRHKVTPIRVALKYFQANILCPTCYFYASSLNCSCSNVIRSKSASLNAEYLYNSIYTASPGGDASVGGAVKTSTASITLKSATLPRRKINAKSEVQLEIKPRVPEQPQPAMRFSTEMQHPVADLRSAPPREGPIPYSPIKTSLQARATSLEPKEHIITIQRPPTQQVYGRTNSNTTTR